MSARKSRDGDSFVFAQYQRIKTIQALAKSEFLPTLRSRDFAVLTMLATHADANGENCCPSAETVAAEMRLNRSTVTESMKELEKNGLIRWTGWSRYRTKNYTITLPTTAESIASLIVTDSMQDDHMPVEPACHMTAKPTSRVGSSETHAGSSEAHVGQTGIRCRPDYHNPIVSISNPISNPIESMQIEHCSIPDVELDEIRQHFVAMGF